MVVYTFGRWRRSVASSVFVDLHIHHALHHSLKYELVVVRAIAFSLLVLVRFEGREQAVDALSEAIIDDALILERLDLVAAVIAFLVYLRLFGADEGLLVYVWVYFNVAIVRQLEIVLGPCQNTHRQVT
jgi:hypothetical protein